MVGVFCLIDQGWATAIRGRLHLFGDREKAVAWMVQSLVDAGEVRMDGLDYRYEGLIYHATDVEVMLTDWQDSLGSADFFHIYPCECRGGVPLVDFGV